MSLLDTAKAVPVTRVVNKGVVDPEKFEAAFAWAHGEVTLAQLATALGAKQASVEYQLKATIFEAVRTDLLVKA